MEQSQTAARSHPAYSALEYGHVRLLHLEPAIEDTDPILCNFHTVSLVGAPSYEAVSYTWGDVADSKTVILEDIEIGVNSNLFLALISLRHRNLPRTLWIDELCINQGDLDERSQQVSLMGRIYRGAESVAVLLGQEWDGLDIVCEYLELAAHNGEAHFVPSLEPHLEVRGQNASSPNLRDNIIQFFLSPWLYRVWIVQEFTLARRVTFYYGRTAIDGERLLDGFYNLRRHASDTCCGIHDSIAHDSPKHGISVYLAMSPLDSLHDLKRYPETMSFLEILEEYRLRQCSDPRDRVYGMLSMPYKGQPSRICPDYSIPVEELFVKLVVEQIEQTQTLDVLSHVVQGVKSTLKLPTYVPDWTLNMDVISFLRHGGRLAALPLYDAAAGTQANFRIGYDSKAVAEGILIDQIEAAGNVSSSASMEGAEYMKAIVDEARTLANLSNRPPGSFEAAGPEEIAFWRTLCGNLSPELKEIRHWKLAEPSVDYESYLRWSRIVEAHTNDDLSIASADVEAFGNALLPNISARRFIRSRKGFIGVVAAESEPGDLLVVLAGGSVPYVLREQRGKLTKDGRASYMFIGDGYIDGLMGGEAVINELKWTTFDLV